MEELFDQIEAAATGGEYYLALMGALVLPDICAGLAADDGLTTRTRYQEWYASNAAHRFHGLEGEDCYFFRCSLLHQGRTTHPKGSYSRILFVEPGATTNVFHMNVLNDALNIDVVWFCRDMVDAARAWLDQVRGTQPFEDNFAAFVRRHPGGLPPYIVGVPVIS